MKEQPNIPEKQQGMELVLSDINSNQNRPPHTTKRTTSNLKVKKQPELPENKIVWKSDK